MEFEGPRGGRVPVRKPGCPAAASGMQKAHKKRTWLERRGVNLADLTNPV